MPAIAAAPNAASSDEVVLLADHNLRRRDRVEPHRHQMRCCLQLPICPACAQRHRSSVYCGAKRSNLVNLRSQWRGKLAKLSGNPVLHGFFPSQVNVMVFKRLPKFIRHLDVLA